MIEYKELKLNPINMSKCCEFLINDKIYYFLNGKINHCESPDLIVYGISKERLDFFSTRSCEEDLLKVIEYCNEIKPNLSFPANVLFKSDEEKKVLYIDAQGRVRGYQNLIEYPKESIIRAPDSDLPLISLDKIIKNFN